ncbi:MAG TPA: hypothetical protein DHV42_01030 [Lachnospiraceae bacterium]|nr:hypothetical protein [Lachnospiraceae bacterium]
MHFGKDDFRRIALCVLSGAMISLNLQMLVRSGGLYPGGLSGTTILIQDIFKKFQGINIPYGRLYMLLNLPPVWLGLRKIGKKFTLYTFITIGVVTLLTEMIPSYTITDDPLLISVFGGIINGASIAVALSAGATTGGTDFVSIYLTENTPLDGFTVILGFNAVMLSVAGFLFGWERALYSIIFQYATTQVVHFLNNRYKKDTVFVVTDHPNEIVGCLNRCVKHGITEMKVLGAYKGEERTLIYTVISSPELKKVLKTLKETDPHAFVNVIRTERVTGRFYIKPND